MAQKRITINVPASLKYTQAELDALKNAFNTRVASIHAARKGEDDSPVGETNIGTTPSKQKTPSKKSSKKAKKATKKK